MASDKERGGDCADEVESVEEEETGQTLGHKLMEFPNVAAALQSQRNAEMLASLPPSVKRRIKALKKLQLEANHIEVKFFKEVHELECKYHKLYTPLYEKRFKVINGMHEPTDAEAEWPSDSEDEELAKELKEKATVEEKPVENVEVVGVPNFWLTIFRNVNTLSEMVQPHDEPILEHLTDITTVCKEDPMGFVLEFHFSPNEYFTNPVLTKEYFMKCYPDSTDPLNFEGPEIFKCAGCTINWNKGKNVTLKTIKKKQKHKSRGVLRTVAKTVQNDSFFNFFNPPTLPDDAKEEDVDDELRQLLTTDFEIGHYFRERIITRAVLYFTGEAVDDDEDEFEEEEEEDDEEEEYDRNMDSAKKNAADATCKQQ